MYTRQHWFGVELGRRDILRVPDKTLSATNVPRRTSPTNIDGCRADRAAFPRMQCRPLWLRSTPLHTQHDISS